MRLGILLLLAACASEPPTFDLAPVEAKVLDTACLRGVSLAPTRDTLYVMFYPIPCEPVPSDVTIRTYPLPRDVCRFTVQAETGEPEPLVTVDCRRNPR